MNIHTLSLPFAKNVINRLFLFGFMCDFPVRGRIFRILTPVFSSFRTRFELIDMLSKVG